jgi:dihydroorotase-like cyclic amidohydrolase
MSIFGSIYSAIFGSPASVAPAPSGGAATATAPAAAGGATTAAAPAAAAAKPMSRAEVEAMIAKVADGQDGKYNWKQSIVDLMKLLKLDSSLAARKQLAQELGYTGALDGSAEMNVWLHKQIMAKLAESGGQVPDSLKRA